MELKRITYLIRQSSNNQLTDEEREELLNWMQLPENATASKEILQQQLQESSGPFSMPAYEGEQVLEAIFYAEQPGKKITPVRRLYIKLAAAAMLMAVIVTAYFMLMPGIPPEHSVTAVITHDVAAPVTTKATITLADGSVLYIDSVGNGQLAQQDGVQLVKLGNGRISYNNTAGQNVKTIQYNTLTNPRGSPVIDMILSDGSRVWLNAGSSVTYPVAFTANERRVTITGEAYFEVEPDKTKPFLVRKGSTEVQVLGTHFNVNAYDDIPGTKITLLEGSVRITDTSAPGALTLTPGQQGVTRNGGLVMNNHVDIEEVMAWKNGEFIFKNAAIETIMEELMRWYDVEVIFQGKKPAGHYVAMISRGTNLSEVLKMLELSGIKTRVQGKRIIVSE